MQRRRLGRWTLPIVGLGLLVLSGCSRELPLNTLDPKGDAARSIDRLMDPVFIVAGVVFLVVNVGVVYIAIRFRRRRSDGDVFPRQIHGNPALELTWTILPLATLGVISVFTLATLFDLFTTPDDTTMTVEVQGQQWWWSYRYDVDGDGSFDGEDDLVTATEMVIPAGQKIALKITSNDVIHSFWIPQLNGKRDAVPGRVSDWWLEADDPGYYLGQCTEYCGLSHAFMRMAVRAVPEDDFVAWMESQQEVAEPPLEDEAAMRGLDVFVQQCASCHLIEGVNSPDCDPVGTEVDPGDYDPETECYPGVAEGYTGAAQVSGNAPDLTHLMSRERFIGGVYDLYLTDDDGNLLTGEDGGLIPNVNTIQAWIRNPDDFKPMAPEANAFSQFGRGMPNLNLTEDQLDDITAYLLTLGPPPINPQPLPSD